VSLQDNILGFFDRPPSFLEANLLYPTLNTAARVLDISSIRAIPDMFKIDPRDSMLFDSKQLGKYQKDIMSDLKSRNAASVASEFGGSAALIAPIPAALGKLLTSGIYDKIQDEYNTKALPRYSAYIKSLPAWKRMLMPLSFPAKNSENYKKMMTGSGSAYLKALAKSTGRTTALLGLGAAASGYGVKKVLDHTSSRQLRQAVDSMQDMNIFGYMPGASAIKSTLD